MDDIKVSNGILASIAQWAREEKNSDMIKFAYSTAGGWEGWAQVEFAARLQRDHGHMYGFNEFGKIHREVKIYQSSERQKADIAIYRNDTPSAGAFIFELKCESSGNSEKFKTEVLKDQEKVKSGLKPGFKSADIWVIGLAVSPEANLAMANSGAGFQEYKYETGPVKIWWWKKAYGV